MRSALEMHDLEVQLYRQRMRREHPECSRAEIDGLVRGWLTAPPPAVGCAYRQENRVMATPVESALRRAVADLNALKAQWALIGGLAVSDRWVPRFTKDLDFAVAVAGDPEAEDVVHRLGGGGYRPVELLEQEYVKRMSGVGQARGFNREQDVVADLDKLIADMRR